MSYPGDFTGRGAFCADVICQMFSHIPHNHLLRGVVFVFLNYFYANSVLSIWSFVVWITLKCFFQFSSFPFHYINIVLQAQSTLSRSESSKRTRLAR